MTGKGSEGVWKGGGRGGGRAENSKLCSPPDPPCTPNNTPSHHTRTPCTVPRPRVPVSDRMCTYVRTHRGVCAGTLFPVCAPMCCNPGAYVHVCAVHGFHDFSSRPHGSYVQRRRGMCMRWGPLCAASCSELEQGMCMYVRPAFCMCRLCLCVPTVGWKYHTTIHGRTRTYPCTYPSANNRTYPQEAGLHIPPGVARKRRYRNECLVEARLQYEITLM